ncbi:SDR family NAD(P)-dependent oxidoreductase [Paenibacillus sp. sgz5001063]|uniref:SDR family NAD(P)-dependent oxidoreductase n=1 Tax=Paenibacillus sp. sgz5001063 TaxID=3242474 RepID=UPI0036D3C3BC
MNWPDLKSCAPETGSDMQKSVMNVSKKDIAIIGMAGRFAGAGNLTEFWEALRSGRDMTGDFPEERRKDAEPYIRYMGSLGISDAALEYTRGGFMPEVDQFDASLFRLSPKEASLMDPNQRLFLEAAWQTIEDAGYGGGRLHGSRTGVFLGYSTDFYDEYKRHILHNEPEHFGMATSGNIKSITASRIAYLLDLKGPSMLIDTACSSSLVAVHQACQAIRHGECDQALAGGVKVLLTPVQGEKEWAIGIQSSDGQARTFDDSSDGTGIGEGVAAVMLKSLRKAIEDGDDIYAVIKGSAVNQDGTGAGLTAPNPGSQEEVIQRAWREAGIDPNSVTYIEAHGTGTRLGDPIEISGIDRAFRPYASGKQFCAVGSVKTNIGHLDSSAGIAGLVKCVMALRHGEIPSSLHFNRPNRQISFENSAVFVNDSLMKWDKREQPRRCGINSFGLSGTNCHLVLEESPLKGGASALPASAGYAAGPGVSPYILTLSAQYSAGLAKLAEEYAELLAERDYPLDSLCYTANTGRGHYEHRAAILFEDKKELCARLNELAMGDAGVRSSAGKLLCGFHKEASRNKEHRLAGELSEAEQQRLNSLGEAALGAVQSGEDLHLLCELYVQGADISWERLYKEGIRRLSGLPSYPFNRKRCWIQRRAWFERSASPVKEHEHPLVGRQLAASKDFIIYSADYSPEHLWALEEHKVFGQYVLPGTAYLEIAREIGIRQYPDRYLEIREMTFLTPLSMAQEETREVHFVIEKQGEELARFYATSQNPGDGNWIVHAEALLAPNGGSKPPRFDLNKYMEESAEIHLDSEPRTQGVIVTGPRWDTVKKAFAGDDGSTLLYLELPDSFISDLETYALHPSMMDCAINASNLIAGSDTFLPFFYTSLRIYGRAASRIYSYASVKQQQGQAETAKWNIVLMDEEGQVFAEIEDYVIKKVSEVSAPANRNPIYHEVVWSRSDLMDALPSIPLTNGPVLIFRGSSPLNHEVIAELKRTGRTCTEVIHGLEYRKHHEGLYEVSPDQEAYNRLIRDLSGKGITDVLHMLTIGEATEPKDITEFQGQESTGLFSLFYLIRALLKNGWTEPVRLNLVSDYARTVTADSLTVNPLHGALCGLLKGIELEHPQIKCRSLDIDDVMQAGLLVQEILSPLEYSYEAAYRNHIRYLPQLIEGDVASKEKQPLVIKDSGAYVITGGTGSLGMEAARFLAARSGAHLILISRNPRPENKNSEMVGLREEQAHYYYADVSSGNELEQVLKEVRSKYGPIHGVIHCAGMAGNGFLSQRQEEDFAATLQPKTRGTWNLDRLTRQDDLDFFITYSSITSLTGAPGQSDYTAANAYLDAFSQSRNLKGLRTVSINWTAWKEIGMAADFGRSEARGLFLPITTRQAMEALDEILHARVENIVVGELDLETLGQLEVTLPMLHNRVNSMRNPRRATKRKSQPMPLDRPVVLTGKMEAEWTAIDQKLGNAWGKVLGLEQIDVFEHFNHLGGDSILATHLLRELDLVFPGMLDISDVFTYSTIHEMSRFIDGKTGNQRLVSDSAVSGTEEQFMDDVLERLAKGEISAEMAGSLFGEGEKR